MRHTGQIFAPSKQPPPQMEALSVPLTRATGALLQKPGRLVTLCFLLEPPAGSPKTTSGWTQSWADTVQGLNSSPPATPAVASGM